MLSCHAHSNVGYQGNGCDPEITLSIRTALSRPPTGYHLQLSLTWRFKGCRCKTQWEGSVKLVSVKECYMPLRHASSAINIHRTFDEKEVRGGGAELNVSGQ